MASNGTTPHEDDPGPVVPRLPFAASAEASIPALSDRPGAAHHEGMLEVLKYSVVINGGRADGTPDGSLASLAGDLPYIGVSLDWHALDLPGAPLSRAFLVFGDDLAGRIEHREDQGAIWLFVGQPAWLHGAVHRLLQTERPVIARVGYWTLDGMAEVTEFDLIARRQEVGQREG